MRKRTINQGDEEASLIDYPWLDLERLAQFEITSEDASHPIESAIKPGVLQGWRAAHHGEQTIRLLFDEPTKIRHIRLMFHEDELQRTQEFVLRWSADDRETYRDIVRQQYNFSPPDTISEVEDYSVDLEGVKAIELKIVPDISRSAVYASLQQFLLA